MNIKKKFFTKKLIKEKDKVNKNITINSHKAVLLLTQLRK